MEGAPRWSSLSATKGSEQVWCGGLPVYWGFWSTATGKAKVGFGVMRKRRPWPGIL